jgi:hypothetical protein
LERRIKDCGPVNYCPLCPRRPRPSERVHEQLRHALRSEELQPALRQSVPQGRSPLYQGARHPAHLCLVVGRPRCAPARGYVHPPSQPVRHDHGGLQRGTVGRDTPRTQAASRQLDG